MCVRAIRAQCVTDFSAFQTTGGHAGLADIDSLGTWQTLPLYDHQGYSLSISMDHPLISETSQVRPRATRIALARQCARRAAGWCEREREYRRRVTAGGNRGGQELARRALHAADGSILVHRTVVAKVDDVVLLACGRTLLPCSGWDRQRQAPGSGGPPDGDSDGGRRESIKSRVRGEFEGNSGARQRHHASPRRAKSCCGSFAEKLRELCGNAAGAMRKSCGKTAEQRRKSCGKDAERRISPPSGAHITVSCCCLLKLYSR